MKSYLSFTLFLLATLGVWAQEAPFQEKPDSVIALKEVILSNHVIFGSKFHAKNRTGSAYYLSPEELKKFSYTDINRALKNIPGVNSYEEDGFGLRPNISLRGTSPERSAKITLMEDGVLISPAPYSAPAAYYFPFIGRMHAIEILKGSSQISYGPFTTGGVINMISTPIPEQLSGDAEATYGSFNSSRFRLTMGDFKEQVGYLIDYLNYRSDGFKNLDNGANTGFNRNDVVAKFRIQPYRGKVDIHGLEFKFQYADEDSNETYLGLSQPDFDESPFRRYVASQKDKMDAQHVQFTATHTWAFNSHTRLTTTGYYNGFRRNWYKLNDVVVNGEKTGLATVLEDPLSYEDAYELLAGEIDGGVNTLLVKANNRAYQSKGIQTRFNYHFNKENTAHHIEMGIRYHYDEEDRFQWVDGYDMVNGIMHRTMAGVPGTDTNRISSATALAAYFSYKFTYRGLTLTPGLRTENIWLERVDYGKNDPARTGIALVEGNNKVTAWIPGIGFHYVLTNRISFFGGVHKGFAPPGNQAGQEPEKSVNTELGGRFHYSNFSGEATVFYNHYKNLLGSDLAATGGTGSSDLFNAGKVMVRGVECLFTYRLPSFHSKIKIPLTVGYTYTHTRFLESFTSQEELWGEVTAGDELPYLVPHQIHAIIALEHPSYECNILAKYNSSFRTRAGNGPILLKEQIPSNFILDVAAAYHWNKHLSTTVSVLNLLDEVYAVSRAPAGLRPGMPFGVYGGIRASF